MAGFSDVSLFDWQLEVTGAEIISGAHITVTAPLSVRAASADVAFDCIPTANTASVP